MRILEDNKNIIVENVADFNLEQTLECGQCFRFYKQNEQEYVVVAYKHLLHAKQEGQTLFFLNTDRDTVENLWIPYFDLERNYDEIKKFLREKDEILKNAITEKGGVRILNQEFHEVLISFIISQNKQIPQIKQLVRRISETYGTYLGKINGEAYYSFPDIKTLGTISEQDFRKMKTGFRAPYLFDAAQKLSKGEISAKRLSGLTEAEMQKKLMEIKGVGEKVANCVMLFSLGCRSAFPVDVWIKRIVETLYFDGEEISKDKIREFASEHYGAYGGYAQQYLFCFGREKRIGTGKE